MQGRVLAAALPSSSTPLLQARGADSSLIITTRQASELPVGAHSLIPMPPGCMKYGWSSEPQQYAQPRGHSLEMSRSAAASAASAALLGLEEEDVVAGSLSDALATGSSAAGEISAPTVTYGTCTEV